MLRGNKVIGNEHPAALKKKGQFQKEDAIQKIAKLDAGSQAYKSALLAIKKQEMDMSTGGNAKSTEDILNEVKKKKGGENVTLSDLENLR